MRRVYMDSNATTPLLPEVMAAMQPFWMEQYGNASSAHRHGQQARGAVERARMVVAKLLGCKGAEIVFTSGGTESDNLALFGVLPPDSPEKIHLITTTIEHHAVLHAAEALAARGPRNVEVTFLACNVQGVVEPASLEVAMRPNTKLVSIIFANNETGTVQPVAELARIVHAAGALFHTDAVQAVGKLPIDLAGDLHEVDLLSLSGHKMHAPQGVGVLFVRQGLKLAPLFHGGSHERQRRAGTENVPGIVGLGKAAELGAAWLVGDGVVRLAALRDRLERALVAQIEGCGVNGGEVTRTCNTTNLFFEGVDAEALLISLDLQGLAISAGSACQSGAAEPSHVLTAMGLPLARARASVRISLSKLTMDEDVDYALEIIPAAVARLRKMSAARGAVSRAAI